MKTDTIIDEGTNNIRLMLYDEPDNSTILFYLLGISPVEALLSFPKTMKFKKLKLVASKSQHFIYPSDIEKKDTLANLLTYFQNNQDYTIDDLTAVFDDNTQVYAHDDSEITMIVPNNQTSTSRC